MKTILILVAASVLLLVFVVQQWVGVLNLFGALGEIQFSYLPLIILLPFGSLLIHALRWKIIIKSIGIRTRFSTVYRYTLIGAAFSNLTPMVRFGGEPFKAYLYAKEISVPKKKMFASITIDSLTTAVTILSVVYLGALSLFVFNVLDAFALWLVLTVLLLPITLGAYMFYEKRVLVFFSDKISKAACRLKPGLCRNMRRDMLGFRKDLMKVVKDKRTMSVSVFLSFLERLTEILTFYVIMLALGVDFSMYSSAIVIGVGIMGGLIPFLPGGMVTYESFSFAALAALGVPPVVSALSVLIYRGVDYWLVSFAGLGTGWLHGINFSPPENR